MWVCHSIKVTGKNTADSFKGNAKVPYYMKDKYTEIVTSPKLRLYCPVEAYRQS